MTRRPRLIAAVLGAAGAVLLGCVSETRPTPSGRGPNDSPGEAVSVTYSLGPAATAPLLAALQARAGEPSVLPASFSAEDGASEASTAGSPATTTGFSCRLEIARVRRAEARVVLTVTAPGRPASAYELLLPAAEFDLILADLRASGVLDGPVRPTGAARVEIHSGDGTVAKDWTPEPRLDELAERVLRDGRPVRHGGRRPGQARITAG